MTSSSSKFNSLLNFDHLQFAIINFRADWTAAEYSVHPELHHKLGNIILQLDHWSCLKTILIYIHKCFNIDGGKLQNLESLVKKMEAVSEKITKELQIARAEKFILERPLKALNVLRVLEINIEIFKPEIGQVLEYLFSLSSSSLEFQSSLDLGHLSHLDRSLQSVRGILRYIWAFVDEDQEQQIDAFQTKVFSLQSFLLGVLDFEFGSCSSDPVIDHFFSHVVGSLAVRIAYQSYHYWIKATDETTPEYLESNLRYLQREIDPSTPGFWDLTLKFLTSINMITNRRHEGLAHSFVCYLIHWDRERDILPTLKSLVTYAINEREESGEDVQSLSAEIKALLRLAHSTNLEEFYFCFCLLGIEVFVKEQLRSSSTNFLKEQNQIKELNESSNFARNFSCDLPEENIANGFLEVVSGAIRKVEYLYQSFHAKRVTEKAVRASLLCLLLEIVFTKAETYASELLVNDASLMAFGKDRIETINQGLDLFEAFIRSQRMEALAQGIQAIFLRFEAAARRGTSLYYSFLIEQTTEEMMQKGSSILFSDLLDKMKIIKLDLTEMLPPFQRSNFPKTNGVGFIDFLLGNMRELLRHDPKSIASVKHHIEGILLDCEFFRSFLLNFIEQEDTHQSDLKEFGVHITSVAYEVEYVIDSIEVGICDPWQHLFRIHELLEEIKSIKMKVTEIYDLKISNARVQNVTTNPNPMVMHARIPKIDETVVCLDDQMEDIIDQLTRGSSQRDVVSIIGMPGIGKTTFAKQVYEDLKVAYHFHVRAWCSVSQVYQKKDLLLEILRGISGLTDDVHQMIDEDLELKLYRNLKQKRYLIVMDDVWDTKAWSELERSLPNDENGSRILMTSRVALEVKLNSNPYSLRLLSDDESWKLLQTKIFHGDCPEELLEVGKEIAQNCKGLPLAIVSIGGLLERKEKKRDVWKTIAESLNSRIIADPQMRCLDILQLSYKHLPDYLKPCFLYIGSYLKDKDIPVSKLLRLWIAEGFIQKSDEKGLEDLAEDYLMDLIGRSLVTISKKTSTGRVKTCLIHDLLRELCLSIAKQNNFLQLITRYDEPYTSFDDVDGGLDFYEYRPSNPVTYEKYRLFFSLKRKHFVNSSPSGPYTRSLLFFAATDTYPRRPYDVSFISEHFKLLRVLDLESVNIGTSFPKGMDLLLHLRYLSVSGDIESIPPSIASVWKLETFIVKGLKSTIILPITIWSMTSLRHLHINENVDFDLEDQLESSSELPNLVTFSTPSFSYGKDNKKIVSMLPNLHKLKCIILESQDSSEKCNQFPGLELLTHLESLKIFYIGKALNPIELSIPLNLKKLTLSNFRLPWDRISIIGGLKHLEVLKLVSRAFEGRTWEMTEGEFLELRFLKLDTLNIAIWNASGEHLPKLERLLLRNCQELEEVPYGFVDISTLQMIDVQSCGQSTEESARTIGDEGIEGLRIFINQSLYV